MKYKVGDRLKRLKSSHDGMNVGDIGTITEITDFGFKFKEFNRSGGSHTKKSDYWELVSQSLPFKKGDKVKCIRPCVTLKRNITYIVDDCYIANINEIYVKVSEGELKESGGWESNRFELVKNTDNPLSIWSLNNEMFIVATGQIDIERALISLKDGKAYHFPKPDLEAQGYKYIGMFNEVFMETETYNIVEETPREIVITESSHLLSGYDNYINELIEGKKKL